MKTFRGFQIFDFKYRAKPKSRKPRKLAFFLLKPYHKVNLFFFWVIFQSVFRFWVSYTTKNFSKSKLSKISEFSNLGIGQNRNLGNLGKFSFTSNFGISCNLRFKNKKKDFHKNLKITSTAKLFFCHNLALNLQFTIFLFEGKIMFHSHDI